MSALPSSGLVRVALCLAVFVSIAAAFVGFTGDLVGRASAAAASTLFAPGTLNVKITGQWTPAPTDTAALRYQVFTGSTTCASGAGAVTELTGIDSGAGMPISVSAGNSVLLAFNTTSDRNGILQGYQNPNSANITYLPGNKICVEGFDNATRTVMGQYTPSVESLAFDTGTNTCTNTPKFKFAAGEKLCARVSGSGATAGTPWKLRISGGGPNSCFNFFPETPVTTETLSVTYTLPANDAAIPGACAANPTTDIRGDWNLRLDDQGNNYRGGRQFRVSNPGSPAASLGVYTSLTGDQNYPTASGAGSPAAIVKFLTSVQNNGPDPAQNVSLTMTVPAGVNYISTIQTGGPAFTCGPPIANVVTCTAATLEPSSFAGFEMTVSYVNKAGGTNFTTNTNVTSSTTDLTAFDNNGTATATVTANNNIGQFFCRPDITVYSTSAAGAVVNYNPSTPTTTLPYSGGFFAPTPANNTLFPIGTNYVTYNAGASGSGQCSFKVIVLDGQNPDLTITKSHSAEFVQGQVGAQFMLSVKNIGALATTGTVTVTDTPPSGMTITAMSGTGWTCSVGTYSCTRNDALLPNSTYPPITVTVNVGQYLINQGNGETTNRAVVSGGGDVTPPAVFPATSNNEASDAVIVAPLGTTPPAPSGSGAPLYTQGPDAACGNGPVSNDSAVNDGRDSQSAGDFTVPAGETWTITQIFANGSYGNAGSPANVTLPVSYHVTFYANSGGSPGAIFAGADYAAQAYTGNGNVTITIPPTVVPAGTYWVSIRGNGANATPAEWLWHTTLPSVGSDAKWRNPGAGFGIAACTANFGTLNSVCFPGSYGGCNDLAFQVIGTSTGAQPPNQPPVNSVPGPQSVAANGSKVFSTGNSNAISISDPDAGANTVTVTITVTNGTFTLNGTAGLAFGTGDGTADTTMTFTGTIANINTALNGATYTPTGGYTGGATLTINTDDNGNTGTGGAQSDNDVVNITVTAINTNTTLVSAPASSVFSQSVTFTATVAPNPGAGTGSITFIEGGTCAAPTTTLSGPTVVNASGQAGFSTSSLTVGSHTVTACYSGGGGFAASSGNNTHVVSKANTTTTITSDNPDGSVFGQDYTVVVTVAPVAPAVATVTGSVTVSDGTNNCSIAALAGGSGSCVLPSTSPGAKTLTATYAATTNFNGSSDTEPHTVNKADTTTALVSAPSPTTYGQSLTLTATVTTNPPGVGTPAGTVNFSDGATPIASCQNVALNGSGVAICTINSLPAGVGKTLSATYSGNANFNGSSGSTSQTINKAPLSVAADAKSKTYGAANPALTYQITGFVLGQTLATSDVAGTPAISTTATQNSPVGSYPISVTAGTLASNNYSFNFTNSTLSVTPAPLTVTADNKSRTYGAANPALTYQFAGFVLGETLATSGVTGTPAISTAATAASPVGTYPITVSAGSLAAANYSFNFVNGTLTVNPATLTVTADNKSRVYGQANPAFTYQFAGFQNGETLATSGVTGTPAVSTAATQFSAPGTYPITIGQGTLAAANYVFSFVNGTLTVAQAATTTAITNAAALGATTNVGQGYSVSFAVAPVAPGSGTPTGTVTVSDGTGATCTGAVAANGTGSCTLTSSTPGDKTITASYGGDTNFTGSSSTGVAHRVVILVAGNVKQYVSAGPANTNLAGVTMTLSSGGVPVATATTDASGNYAFALLTNNANITITPSMPAKVFEAISRSYTNVTNNIAGADFLAYDANGVNSNPREVKAVNTVGTPGQPVTVPVTVISQGNETSLSFTLSYDPALMGVPTSAVCGAAFVGCTVGTFDTSTPGRVGITVSRPATLAAGLREVAKVTFPTFVNTAGSAPVGFADAPTVRVTRNAAGDPLPTLYTAGFVSFTPDLEGDVVGANGSSPGGDGVLSNDVTIVRQMALGLIQPTAGQYRYADTAPRSTLGDGCPINSADVTQTQRYNLGLDPPTAAGGFAAPIPGGCPPVNTRSETGVETERVVRVVDVEAIAGRTVTVAFELDSQGDETALLYGIRFDARALRFVRAEPGKDAPSGARVTLNETKAADGTLGILLDAAEPFAAGKRSLVTVTFEVARDAAAGAYPIEFLSELPGQSTAGADGQLLLTRYTGAIVTVTRGSFWGVTAK